MMLNTAATIPVTPSRGRSTDTIPTRSPRIAHRFGFGTASVGAGIASLGECSGIDGGGGVARMDGSGSVRAGRIVVASSNWDSLAVGPIGLMRGAAAGAASAAGTASGTA